PGAVDVGRVEEGHPEVERGVYRPDRLGVVDLTPAERLPLPPERTADRPTTEPERAHGDPAAAQQPRHRRHIQTMTSDAACCCDCAVGVAEVKSRRPDKALVTIAFLNGW